MSASYDCWYRVKGSPRVRGGLPEQPARPPKHPQVAPCTRGFTIGHEKPHRHSTNAQRRGSRLRSREHRSPRVCGGLPCHHRPTPQSPSVAPCMREFTKIGSREHRSPRVCGGLERTFLAVGRPVHTGVYPCRRAHTAARSQSPRVRAGLSTETPNRHQRGATQT